MRRFNGRLRSATIIGLQGIRARKLRTLLSMVSLFLGVLAVVVVQAGAGIAERLQLADLELQSGIDGTKVIYGVPPAAGAAEAVASTVKGRTDAVAMFNVTAIIGEPGVRPVNEGGGSFDQDYSGGGAVTICDTPTHCYDPNAGAPKGQAIELRISALTGDVRTFRPYRHRSGRWLDFTSQPMLAPGLVLNEEAAKGLDRYHVPAEMRVSGATANMTPRILGVIKDGDSQPHAYVRLDELTSWLPLARLSDPNGGNVDSQVLLAAATPVEPVLLTKLKALSGNDVTAETINSRKEMKEQLNLLRMIFLAMASLVLIIGAAGVLNVGLATVGERVEEFALRRAVGTPRAVLAGIVLAETLLTGLLTAALAIGFSIAALKVGTIVLGPSEPFLQSVVFPWSAGVSGIIAGLAAGILGGFIPAIRAAGIPIATVMRA
ncbi:permease [Actinoplanes sp. SE50]|uniref:ABC transporter permease n=1 Tax=unclassified Actinoplanes TaxID=2626549 RepID=UPI00023ED449|nr:MULTISPECIES: ABC transporter permease [unclassified Actinoplanes]AEV84981.1 Macrolide export ATP-binding/permease protein macB [Actinoplanes sp. SE50/110]ATO83372.1 permease [Actinoplanes sp. SE50]SLM00779.1 permease [Actinoplanes sp. SE50/110]